jgi:glycosyltransferase involved in cell wall biosynthesis
MALFSIIIATRNRPGIFAEALSSVLVQKEEFNEIIVVNDGSDDAHIDEYQDALHAAPRPIKFYSLPQRPNGHGQSYALNYGVSKASNPYICFLDDDDSWTDDGYLARAEEAITGRIPRPDLVFSNQSAFFHDRKKDGPIWLEGLGEALEKSGRAPEEDGLFQLEADHLIKYGHFCHLNTMIVRRELYESVGGMDEGIRWECDHDLFLRLIDVAQSMWLSPDVVSRHNIPDPANASSMTTMLNETQRRLYQLRVFHKASIYAELPAIRTYGRRHLGYTLKRIASTLAQSGDYKTAAFYAWQAMGALPTVKWFFYANYLTIRSMGGKGIG